MALTRKQFVPEFHGWVGCAGMGGVGQAPKGVAETTDGGRTWHLHARVTPSGGSPNVVGSIPMRDYLDGIAMAAVRDRARLGRPRRGAADLRRRPHLDADAARRLGQRPDPGRGLGDHRPRLGHPALGPERPGGILLYATHDGGGTWQAVSAVPPTP